jgi:hypothetical protein
VKLAPANQTFIPASNPGRQRFVDLGQALRTASGGAQLRSVTIVTAQPDDNVMVVQAQYAPDLDSPTYVSPSSALKLIPRQPSGSGRASSYLSPIEQYARTQSGEARSLPLLDVRA